tara:strand:+ start:968 stop:1171 length:204 start_codon:yes stop_codon:yes gene_type:complete
MTKNANYRKNNDRTHNSSTYHKKDGTPTRHLLKQEAKKEIQESERGAAPPATGEQDGSDEPPDTTAR